MSAIAQKIVSTDLDQIAAREIDKRGVARITLTREVPDGLVRLEGGEVVPS